MTLGNWATENSFGAPKKNHLGSPEEYILNTKIKGLKEKFE